MGVDVSASASLISSSTRYNHKADQAVDVEADQTLSNNTTKGNDIVDVDEDLFVDLQQNNLFFDELVDKIPTKLYIAGQSGDDDYNPKYWKGHSKESKVARKAKNKLSNRATFDPSVAERTTTETKQRLENDNNHATISTVPTTLSPAIDNHKSRKEVLREKLHAKLAEKRGNRPCPSDPTTIISKRAARREEKKKRQAEAIQRNSLLCREEVDNYLAQFNQPPQSPPQSQQAQSQQSVSVSLLCRDEVDTYLEYIPIGHPDSMMSTESVRRAVEEFTVQPTDIMVATFPKTGTTVLTWICHLLRTLSDTRINENESEEDQKVDEQGMYEYEKHIMKSFETIYEVVPWPTLSWDIGYDPNQNNQQQQQQSSSSSLSLFPPPLQPRVFKSHLRMASIYRGCKYIVTIRDPGPTAISFYNFFLSKKVPFLVDVNNNNSIPLMDVSTFLMNTPYVKGHTPTPENPKLRPSIWEYYREYHALLECPDVLIVIYEDMVQDMSTTIQRIGQFMNIIDTSNNNDNDNDNDNNKTQLLIEKITRMSTKSFMAHYMSKFDEPYDRAKKFNRANDLTQLAPGKKIAVKKHPQVFTEEATVFLQNQWNKNMNTSPLGYETYQDFVDTIRTRNQQLFG